VPIHSTITTHTNNALKNNANKRASLALALHPHPVFAYPQCLASAAHLPQPLSTALAIPCSWLVARVTKNPSQNCGRISLSEKLRRVKRARGRGVRQVRRLRVEGLGLRINRCRRGAGIGCITYGWIPFFLKALGRGIMHVRGVSFHRFF
jgi:hypothetical protein